MKILSRFILYSLILFLLDITVWLNLGASSVSSSFFYPFRNELYFLVIVVSVVLTIFFTKKDQPNGSNQLSLLNVGSYFGSAFSAVGAIVFGVGGYYYLFVSAFNKSTDVGPSALMIILVLLVLAGFGLGAIIGVIVDLIEVKRKSAFKIK